LKFKGRGPLKFSKKCPATKHYTDIYRLVLLLTHLSFRWTVPFSFQILTSCSSSDSSAGGAAVDAEAAANRAAAQAASASSLAVAAVGNAAVASARVAKATSLTFAGRAADAAENAGAVTATGGG
jgi:hypothetical protein